MLLFLSSALYQLLIVSHFHWPLIFFCLLLVRIVVMGLHGLSTHPGRLTLLTLLGHRSISFRFMKKDFLREPLLQSQAVCVDMLSLGELFCPLPHICVCVYIYKILQVRNTFESLKQLFQQLEFSLIFLSRFILPSFPVLSMGRQPDFFQNPEPRNLQGCAVIVIERG